MILSSGVSYVSLPSNLNAEQAFAKEIVPSHVGRRSNSGVHKTATKATPRPGGSRSDG